MIPDVVGELVHNLGETCFRRHFSILEYFTLHLPAHAEDVYYFLNVSFRSTERQTPIITGACLKSLPEQSKESACASYTTKAAVQLGLAPCRPP